MDDALGVMLAVFGAIAAIGLGFGIVGLINHADYGYPLFVAGLVFLILVVVIGAITGRE